MATEVRDVKFVLSAQDRYSAAINGLRSGLGQIQERVGGVNAVLGKAGTLFGGAFAGATLTAFIRGVANSADELNDLADALGSTASRVSAIEDVAARAGVNIGELSTSLLKFNKTLADAKPGSDQANIFKALGLDAERLRRLDPAEALRQTAAAFNTFASDGQKGRYMLELFGKSTRDVAKFIKDLGDQTELTATVTEQQAAEFRRFGDQVDAIAKNGTDAARALVSHFLPAVNDAASALAESSKRGTLFVDVLKAIATFSPASQVARAVADNLPQSSELQRLQNIVAGLENVQRRDPGNEDNNRRLAQLREQVRLLEQAARFRTLADTGAGGGRGSVNPAAVLPSLPALGGDTRVGKKKAGDPFGPDVPEFLRDAQKAIDAVDSAKIDRLRAQLQQLVSIRAVEGAGAVDEAILDTEDALARLTGRADDAGKALRELLGDLPSARAGALVDLSGELDAAFQRGEVSALQYAEAVAKLDQEFESLTPAAKKAEKNLSDIDEMAAQAARNIQSAMGDTIYRTFKGTTDGIFQLWADLLLRMAAEAAAAQLGKYLFGGSGIAGLGSDIGSALGGLFGGLFANGGTLGAGRWGIAGENGPELITGPAQVTPLRGAQASALGGGNTYITNNVAAGVQRHEVLSLLNQFGGLLMGQVDQRLRRVGV